MWRTANAPNKSILLSQNYQAKISLTNQCKEEIFWWTRQLEANSDTEPRSGNRNRRISAGVGISLPSIDAKEGGQVECPRETASHKCIGVRSSRDCSFISCQEQKRNPCSLENGQHYCSIICEHNWGGGGGRSSTLTKIAKNIWKGE